MHGIKFAQSHYLYLLLLIPALVLWYFYKQKKNNADKADKILRGTP